MRTDGRTEGRTEGQATLRMQLEWLHCKLAVQRSFATDTDERNATQRGGRAPQCEGVGLGLGRTRARREVCRTALQMGEGE